MASPSGSGASSGSGQLLNSSSSEDLQAAMDQRKQKRMLSNRESARRSRMRKQKHLDDLMAQVAQLRKENGQILNAVSITNQHYMAVEAENSVLRTRMLELSTRLQSLHDMLHYMNGGAAAAGGLLDDDIAGQYLNDDMMMRPWNQMVMSQQQPIMASADMFQYC